MSDPNATPPAAPLPKLKKRVVSLDALRGFDLFLLCGLTGIFQSLMTGPFRETLDGSKFWQEMMRQCGHVEWEGFTLHDLIMPLFMFMAGVTIPYSMARFRKSENPNASKTKLILRLARRMALLWIFGMMVQGNLLQLKWEGLRLYSNTLQAIAAGYIIAVILYFVTGKIGQTIAALILMFGFWAAMAWIKVGDFGGGSYAEETNLAEWIDRAVLGRWRDGVSFGEDGTWAFSDGYRYTWILSSLTFGATAISGAIAGAIIKTRSTLEEAGKSGHVTSLILMAIGALLTVIGWGWGKVPEGVFGYCPIVKHIWTPSMVFLASGWSFLLLGFFYEIYDVLHLPIFKTFLVVIGMNSIVIYLIHNLFRNFKGDVERVIFGLEHHIGVWYNPVRAMAAFAVVWFILWVMYRNKKFLRL